MNHYEPINADMEAADHGGCALLQYKYCLSIDM